MPKVLQNDHQYIQKTIYGQVSFFKLDPCQRVLWNHCCMCVPHLFDQSVQYFIQELLITLFLIFFSWTYIILSSKNWVPNFSRKFFFDHIWPKRAPKIEHFGIFFWKLCHLICLRSVWKENHGDTLLIILNLMS